MPRRFALDHWFKQAFIGAALIAVFFAAQAQAQTNVLYTPENAYGAATDPLPGSARLAGANEFLNRWKSGELQLFVPSRAAGDLRKSQDETRALEAQLRATLVRSRPALLDRLLKIRAGADLPFEFVTTRGEKLQLQLMGRDSAIQETMGAQLAFRSKENQKALYDFLQSRLQGQPNIPAIDTSAMEAADIRMVNENLLAILETAFGRDGGSKVPGALGQCDMEEGAGLIGDPDDGDQTGKSCEADPTGLATLADWTLKPYNTCVRNQGSRGASHAFAIAAAMESLAARNERRYANVSEQHLFTRMKLYWFRTPSDFGDGLNPSLTTGAGRLSGYQFLFEDVVPYNPSYNRQENMWTRAYGDSCKWYDGPYCHEANHQGRFLCTTVDAFRYCGYDAPAPMATPITLQGASVLFDINAPDFGLSDTRRLLRTGQPVVLTFAVPASFRNVGKNGYVPFAENERFEGAHAMLLTGWIPNSRRPSGAPEAAGGGYFIAKNSWGRCAGDSGYYYLPLDWVRAHALNLTVIY